jgi:hypothetical protein
VQEAALADCELVKNLPDCDCLHVPFCASEVQAWSAIRSKSMRTFTESISALKVRESQCSMDRKHLPLAHCQLLRTSRVVLATTPPLRCLFSLVQTLLMRCRA